MKIITAFPKPDFRKNDWLQQSNTKFGSYSSQQIYEIRNDSLFIKENKENNSYFYNTIERLSIDRFKCGHKFFVTKIGSPPYFLGDIIEAHLDDSGIETKIKFLRRI